MAFALLRKRGVRSEFQLLRGLRSCNGQELCDVAEGVDQDFRNAERVRHSLPELRHAYKLTMHRILPVEPGPKQDRAIEQQLARIATDIERLWRRAPPIQQEIG